METIRRTKIVDLLKREDFGAMVNVKGWVRTRRGSKQVNFIALNDGSTINNVQIVVDLANFDEELLKLITTGACLSVNGELVMTVTVDPDRIKAIDLNNLSETTSTMYPLIRPAVEELEAQILEKQSTKDITWEATGKYTAGILLNAIEKALDQAEGSVFSE